MVYLFIFAGLALALIVFALFMAERSESTGQASKRYLKSNNSGFVNGFNNVLLLLNLIGGGYFAYLASLEVTVSTSYEVAKDLNVPFFITLFLFVLAYSVFIYSLIKMFLDQNEITEQIQYQNELILYKLDQLSKEEI